jgi:Phosphate-selective porin O and P
VKRLFLLLLLSPTAALADDKVDALRDELRKLQSQLPSAQEGLHTLENRVESLSQEVQRLAGAREADPFVRSAVDELRTEVQSLKERLAATQLKLLQPEEPAVRVGYDGALYLQTEPVRVELGAQIMPRYVGTLRSGRANGSDFELHHGQLAVEAHILGWVDLRLMLDFGAEYFVSQILRDAYVDVRATSWLTLRAGQFKVPFSHQRLVSSFLLTFADRSIATLAFAFDRDLGGQAELHFLDERVLIQAAVTNGLQAPHNDNVDLAYTVRVVGQPLGKLSLTEGDLARGPFRFSAGAAFQYNLVPNDEGMDLDRDGVTDNISVYTVGAELALKWRGLAVEGEYFYRLEQPGAGLPERHFQGGYGQVSYMVWRGLQLGARAGYAQPHLLGGLRLGLDGDQPRTSLEAGGVVNYWVWRDKVRGQLAYDYRRDEQNGVHDGHVLQVQVQAGF